jgi:hypothetical protein
MSVCYQVVGAGGAWARYTRARGGGTLRLGAFCMSTSDSCRETKLQGVGNGMNVAIQSGVFKGFFALTLRFPKRYGYNQE